MNKILKIAIVVVLCLIVILTITLFACNKDPENTTTTTTTTTTTSGNGGTPDPNPDCTEHVDENEDNSCDNCGEPVSDQPDNPADFTETGDKVYVITEGLHLRTSPEMGENTFDWVQQDTELERLGYYSDGWSKVIYDGEEYYVSTDCVTTSKPITSFTQVNETVYFTKITYAFTKPSHIEGYSEADYTFFIGESVTRTGVATEIYVGEDEVEYTFARIEFTVTVDGEETTVVRYVNNSYLTTEAPKTPNPDGDITFATSYDILTVKGGDRPLRKSTVYEDSEIVDYAPEGAVLYAIGKGTESDGTIWYKVQYEGETYYVIYKNTYFDLQEFSSSTTTHSLFEENVGITLPVGFTSQGHDSLGYHFESASAYVLVGYVVNQNTDITGIEEMAQATLENIEGLVGAGVEVRTYNGVVYFEYTTTYPTDNSKVYTLVTFAEGSSNNYVVVEYHCDYNDYEELRADFFTYAKTVTVK